MSNAADAETLCLYCRETLTTDNTHPDDCETCRTCFAERWPMQPALPGAENVRETENPTPPRKTRRSASRGR